MTSYQEAGDIGSLSSKRSLDAAEVTFFSDVQKILSAPKERLPAVVSKICSVDAAYRDDHVVAVASLLENGRLLEKASYSGRCSLPYMSGLFYLREGPFVTEAVRRLTVRPQLVCFDAHGAAHPRSAGLATICGMILHVPSVGIAKSLLAGTVVNTDLGIIEWNGRTVGFVSRISGVRYWSPGYSIGIRELKTIIEKSGLRCLMAMRESHRTAKEQLRRQTESSQDVFKGRHAPRR